MTTRDAAELTITNACDEAGAGYDAYTHEFLSYGANLRDLFKIADLAPQSALINAHAAALHLAFEGAEGWANAKPYIQRMHAAARGASEREQAFCAAVDAWAARNFAGALDVLDELTVRWPADICALKWGQYHAFNLGDHPALLRFGERARIVFDGAPYIHGMTAFALEQNHRLDEAEDEGLKAVSIAIDDAWAHHAVAHVMETQGRARDGVRWLDRCSHTWDAKGVFIRDHNWWHAALFRLSLGLANEALDVFDARLWGEWPEFPQEQIGAISMLWRLELHGVDVGERWAPILAQVRGRADEHILPFHDLHYLYALAKAGEPGEADRFFQSIRSHADRAAGSYRKHWTHGALPAAAGVLAFAEGDHQSAAEHLQAAMPNLHLVGGSHAQRHIFQQTLEHAGGRLNSGAIGR